MRSVSGNLLSLSVGVSVMDVRVVRVRMNHWRMVVRMSVGFAQWVARTVFVQVVLVVTVECSWNNSSCRWT